MRRVCVYCGSSTGERALYHHAARALGEEIARRGLGLVYGGASVGLMGMVADAALAGGAEVIGVIPRGLDRREITHQGLAELHQVETMHERKAVMSERSDAFIALPGGWGTADEMFEAMTWAQLGIHRSPCGFLNSGGYFDGLLAFLDNAVAEGFVRDKHQGMILVDDDPARLLDRFETYQPPEVRRWMKLEDV